MKRGTMTMAMLLVGACARGGEVGDGRASDLQEQYSDRKDELDDCMSLFGDCLATTEDNDGISACAEALQICLAAEPEQEEEPGNDGMDVPDDDEDPEQPDGEPPAEDDDPVAEICDPILQGCLEDPTQFDPFCLEDFEECVAVEVALELQELCEDVQAQCLELDIPNFDCLGLCS